MKEFRYDIVKDHKLYNVFMPAVILLNNLNYKITYKGRENVPEGGGYILAVNHRCAFDPFIAAIGVRPGAVHFMSKKENFKNSLVQWFLTNVNCYPIERGKADLKAIRHSVKILETGKILGIFPEGTRSKTGEFGKPKNGTVYLAHKTKSDILPVSLYYDNLGKKPVRTTVRYGRVIKLEELSLPEKPTKEQLNKASEYVMGKIKELYDLGHND